MCKRGVYLAGAMEKISEEDAKSWRREAVEFFKNPFSCFYTINPMDYYSYGSNEHTNDFEVFRFDIRLVSKSSVVLVNLDSIRKSVGTCDEIFYAYTHEIPVVGFLKTENVLSEDEIKNIIHPWKYIQINRVVTGENAINDAMKYINDYYGRW